MLNLYCYSEKIIYQTDKESDFEAYKLQAQIEGLKTVESEYFPFEVNETGIIKLDSENNPLPISAKKKIEIGLSDLETERKRVLNLINSSFEKSFEEIKIRYTQSEREGWNYLVKECEDWIENKNLETIPSLQAEINSYDPLEITIRAEKILNNSKEYRVFLGTQKNLKNRRLELLKSIKTPEKLLELEKELV